MLEKAVIGFESYVKQLGGFEMGTQSLSISLQCEEGQVLLDNKKCGMIFLLLNYHSLVRVLT